MLHGDFMKNNTLEFSFLKRGNQFWSGRINDYELHYKSYLEPATGVFKGTRQEVGGTVILEMNLEIFPREYRGLAAMRTRDRESTALGVMRAQRVEDEFLVAVTTRHQPLRALTQLVLPQVSPLNLHAALVLAVERLIPTRTGVFLDEKKKSHFNN